MVKAPCAPPAWKDYCGCETISCLTVDMNVCEGTEGMLTLVLRDTAGNETHRFSLDGPIYGNYSETFDLGEAVPAESIADAVLVNESDDSVTLTFLSVIGSGPGFGHKYIKHKGDMVIDSQSPRMAML
jgi:hypothetical protein